MWGIREREELRMTLLFLCWANSRKELLFIKMGGLWEFLEKISRAQFGLLSSTNLSSTNCPSKGVQKAFGHTSRIQVLKNLLGSCWYLCSI